MDEDMIPSILIVAEVKSEIIKHSKEACDQ